MAEKIPSSVPPNKFQHIDAPPNNRAFLSEGELQKKRQEILKAAPAQGTENKPKN